ncbi:MAG: hypothetical protein M3Y69_10165, partial [Verrucomicrobiota bacterium]|nr:hypothetical protein [Verrucomicrobiota bacterium]
LGACLPLVVAASLALRGDYWKQKPAERRALILLVAFSAVGTAAGGRYYPHYYIQLIPPLALLAAPYLFRLWCRTTDRRPRRFSRVITVTWLALTVLAFWFCHWQGLIPERAPSEAGNFIREHAQTNDRIFVWGHDPKVYLNSQRRPASRYIVTFPLTGSLYAGPNDVDTTNRISDEAWRLLASDLEQHPPAFIVDLQADRSFEPVRQFPILAKLLAQQYEPVAHPREGLVYRRIALAR